MLVVCECCVAGLGVVALSSRLMFAILGTSSVVAVVVAVAFVFAAVAVVAVAIWPGGAPAKMTNPP